MLKTKTQSAFGVLLALALICLGVSCISPRTAYADGDESVTSLTDLQQRVEESSKAYDEACAKSDELQARIDDNNAKTALLQAQIPTQQAKSDAAVTAMYKMQKDSLSMVNLLMGADNVGDFLRTWQYLNDIQERNVAEINKLNKMINELNTAQTQITADKIAADKQKEETQSAFQDAVAAREAAQQAALAAAAAQAAEAEAAAAAAEGSSGVVSDAGVDWSQTRTTFVNQWGPRINNYLAGSPLAGQGATFAGAAWDYGVDPRWSPAISNTESSKGAYCFKPYNAWGWGSYSFGSWEEAIPAHVKYLGECYGYTITPAAARKYCPPNASSWYSKTLSQMNSI